MHNKTALILVGLPASGKSTWVKHHINQLHNVKVISSDDHVEQLAKQKGLTYSEAFKDVANEAMQLMAEDVKNAIKNNNDIVWDQTNLTVKSRASKLKQLKDAGYTVGSIIFNIPENVRKQRAATRAEIDGKNIPDSVIQNMRKTYQVPTVEEGFDFVQIAT